MADHQPHGTTSATRYNIGQHQPRQNISHLPSHRTHRGDLAGQQVLGQRQPQQLAVNQKVKRAGRVCKQDRAIYVWCGSQQRCEEQGGVLLRELRLPGVGTATHAAATARRTWSSSYRTCKHGNPDMQL